MRKRLLITLMMSFALGACSSISRPKAPMNNMYNNYLQTGRYASNGEQIYFTATDQNGTYISHTGGPNFGGMMMSDNLTCASCHGNDGHGGTHYMHMQAIEAPAINYDALIEMKKEDSGGNPMDYSLDDLRGAVVEGHDTAGDQLSQDMPRWQMNDTDLTDLLAFLKTLP